MNNIIIMSGEEIVLKQDKVNDIKKDKSDWNYKKVIIDVSKSSEILKNYISDCFVYLTTVDMFNLNNKILNVVVENPKVAIELLEELINYVGDNILIIDIRTKDIRSLLSNKLYKSNSKKIELFKANKLEEKTRQSTLMDIKKDLESKNISFESKEVEDFYINYIYDNSNYSYTAIRVQLEQLKYMNKEKLSKSDILMIVDQSFNGNYYVLINNIFKTPNKVDLMDMLELKFNTFDKSEYIAFFNIFIYTLKDYIRYSNNIKCKNGSNYYCFKNSNLKINNINEFILKIHELNFKCRVSSYNVKEELLMLIWNYFE